jgi:putative ABC transport system permease protein
MLMDLRYALRNLQKTPGVTFIAFLTLALGVGANTAVFSVLDAVLLRAFPLQDPDRLVVVWESNPALGSFIAERVPVCLKNYLEWKQRSQSFSQMGTFENGSVNLTGAPKPEQVDLAKASPDLFTTLGVRPAVGRTFASNEGDSGRNRVAVLSYSLYHNRFGGDRSVLGQTIRLNGASFTVVGVLPADFELPAFWEGMDQKKPDVWVPLNTNANQGKDQLQERNKYVFARLKPGATLEQARAEMNVIAQRRKEEDPKLNEGFSASVFPIRVEDVGPGLRRAALVLQCAVGFVLLIACANVANLLLARATGREKEVAVRMALGAGRWQIWRQMLTESMLLSVGGGLAGLLLAWWGIAGIAALAPSDVHNLHELRLDPRVLGFTIATMLLTGLIFGFAPALHAARQNVSGSLNRGGRAGVGGMSKRLRGALVVSEVALALVLLVGAGLMVRSMQRLLAIDPGFRADHLLKLHVSLPESKYPRDEQVASFCRRLLSSLASTPGVQSAAITSALPMEDLSLTGFRVEGAPEPAPGSEPTTDWKSVSADYFQTMGSPLLRGRSFTRQDAEEAESHVVIVNESIAKRYWPGQDPLGKAILVSIGGGERKRRVIIGVVGDSRQLGLDTEPRPEIYFPSDSIRNMRIIVRTTAPPLQLATAVTNAVLALDKDQPVASLSDMESLVRSTAAPRRFNMMMLGMFGALALILSSVGLYGVLAYSVTQRSRELGVRVALGATPADLARLVVGQGLALTLVGVAIGLAGAFALTRLMESLIYGVTATDPLTFALVGVGLTAIAMLASYIPARRAAHADPVEALRAE